MQKKLGLLIFTGCIVGLSGCATFRPGAPEGRVDIIAHRGASHNAPENTLAAFHLAHEMQADWFELDCHLTRDDQIIVLHDNDLERITGNKVPVAEYDLAALKAMDAGAWKNERFAGEPLPTLGESLDFAKNKIGVYIEIKNQSDDSALMAELLERASHCPVLCRELAKPFMAAIEASGTRNLPLTRKAIAEVRARRMEKQVVMQSFTPIACAIVKLEAPDIRVELLSGVEADKHEEWELVCRWAHLLGVDGVNLSAKGLTPGRLAALQQSGKSVAVWTVDDPAEMRLFLQWGVNAVITNRPDLCRRTLY